MGLLSFFPKVQAIVKDKGTEYVSISRVSKSITTKTINSTSNVLLQDNSIITNGDLLEINGDSYFVTAKRESIVNTVCQLQKVNCSISIVRLEKQYSPTGAFTGKYVEQLLYSDVPALYTDVSARMILLDPGMLASTTREFILPKLAGIQLLDRIKLGTDIGQIDSINSTKYENLWTIQTSIDKRGTA